MITQAKNIEDEIVSLASSIKKNMVDPAGQRLERLELRMEAAERSAALLARAFIVACLAFSAGLGAVVYWILA